MVPALARTHRLECERFAESLRAVVEAALDEVTRATVYLHEEERRTEPDGEECARVWANAREAFRRTPEVDDDEGTAWTCDLRGVPDRTAVLNLIDLTDGVAGQRFVFRLELSRDGTPVLDAVPHHSDAGIDATAFDDSVLPRIRAQLSDHAACLVPTGTRVEWVCDDRRWSIGGFSLCKATLDERRTSCYGLSNLRRVRRDEDGATLWLDWETDPIGDDLVGRTLSRVVDRLYSPPRTLPCETPERARRVEATLREMLLQYDGRSV
ncbi:hypothetical protein [Halostella litorea]|uniref:hypothetical protein n=1 Tax=Halostella litorea TaxID=2528831 RepID=UPI001091967D|nr:hypothetical protein [Halostella litorea]